KSNKSKIEITGSKSKDVSIKNSNGMLKIRLKFPEGFTAEDLNIKIYYANNIDILDANEGAIISSKETFKQQHIEVKVQEGAKINMAINTKHLVVKSVSGGIIKLEGVAQNQSIEATTGGIYEAFKVQSKQAVVTAASGARVEVNITEVLDAKVRFGGTIYYQGTPEVLKIKKIIGGTISDKNYLKF
ncbi:MAG: DUF2807 domain-containing protein, partial [Lutibacter sp.]|nr:DUF2807 domain-containing protein [Lutibacter sp.]